MALNDDNIRLWSYIPILGLSLLMVSLAFKAESLLAGIGLGLTAGLPLMINQHYINTWACRAAQMVLLVSGMAYMMLLGYLYWEVFRYHKDPLGPVAFVFVGVYALIIMIPLWILLDYVNMRFTKKQN